jgi:hypothetical protein
MPEPTLLDPTLKKACGIFLGLGAVVLTVDLYLGFVKHANSALVFSLLGITTLVFATVLFMLLRPSAFAFLASAKSEPEASAAVNPEPKASVGPESASAVESQPMPAAIPQSIAAPIPQPETNEVEPAAESAPQALPATKSEAELEPNTDLGKLLDMTLGDILVAALRKDPESAGRIFARAVAQADASAPAAKAGAPKGRDSA